MNKTVGLIFAVCAAMFASCSRVEELTLEEIARIKIHKQTSYKRQLLTGGFVLRKVRLIVGMAYVIIQ